ncbi:MAG: hypothetical protein GY820_48460, partial [Gammaproteobacteria bacterium]|nr:hypothetical protein [Gammaproteobacteria bacterium]
HPYLIPGHDNTTRCRSFTPLLDASTITTELVMRTDHSIPEMKTRSEPKEVHLKAKEA